MLTYSKDFLAGSYSTKDDKLFRDQRPNKSSSFEEILKHAAISKLPLSIVHKVSLMQNDKVFIGNAATKSFSR
jgi:hypothetical protein